MTSARHRRRAILAAAACVLSLVAATSLQGQGRGAGPKPAPAPAPRHPDGRVNFGPPPGETGVWERRNEHLVINPRSYQAAATKTARIHIDAVPLQPWARALTDHRHQLALASEPYTRCKPAGGPRQFMSPYGLEIVEFAEQQRIFIFNISNAQSYRTVYMDGRGHPATLTPSFLGHSVGRWEGDTLVIDSVGFNEDFWMNRDGLPHTSQLHLTERLTRTDFDTLNYEVTIDDPGAYTAPWTSGYTLGWTRGSELFEYICQENNLSPEGMLTGVPSRVVPVSLEPVAWGLEPGAIGSIARYRTAART